MRKVPRADLKEKGQGQTADGGGREDGVRVVEGDICQWVAISLRNRCMM